jgi:hypothetical protein
MASMRPCKRLRSLGGTPSFPRMPLTTTSTALQDYFEYSSFVEETVPVVV